MRIRIRRKIPRTPAPIAWAARHGAVYSAGLTLLALLSFAICIWRWCWDLQITPWFPIPTGVASHWQVWFGLGAIFLLLGNQLAHYARARWHNAAS